MEKFNKFIDEILRYEGGETIDTGGYTKFGISQKAYPDFDIEDITVQDAKKIYYENYYIPLQCDKMSVEAGFVILDTAINTGKKRAIAILQKAINYFLHKENKIKVDGIIGKNTISALETVEKINNSKIFANIIIAYRMKFYINLAKNNKYAKYLRGWLNRIFFVTLFLNKIKEE